MRTRRIWTLLGLLPLLATGVAYAAAGGALVVGEVACKRLRRSAAGCNSSA